jgi:hypothetical protein
MKLIRTESVFQPFAPLVEELLSRFVEPQEWKPSAVLVPLCADRLRIQQVDTLKHCVGTILGLRVWPLADDETTLVQNDAEHDVIAEIRDMRSRGRKLQGIADALTEHGIPTKTGRSNRWSHQAVARILNRS